MIGEKGVHPGPGPPPSTARATSAHGARGVERPSRARRRATRSSTLASRDSKLASRASTRPREGDGDAGGGGGGGQPPRARDESSDDDDDDDARERASTFERKMRQVCRRLARDRELVGDVDAGRR
jgi:hypothetical protein